MAYKIFKLAPGGLPSESIRAELQHQEDPKVVFNDYAGEDGQLSWDEAEKLKLGYQVVKLENEEVLASGELSFKDRDTFLSASADTELDNDPQKMNYQEWRKFIFMTHDYNPASFIPFKIYQNRDAPGFRGPSTLPRCQEDHVAYDGKVKRAYNFKKKGYDPEAGATLNEDAVKRTRQAVHFSIRDTIRDTWPQNRKKIEEYIAIGNINEAYVELREYAATLYATAVAYNPHTAGLCQNRINSRDDEFFQLKEMKAKEFQPFWQEVSVLLKQIVDAAEKSGGPGEVRDTLMIPNYRDVFIEVSTQNFMGLIKTVDPKLVKRIQKLEKLAPPIPEDTTPKPGFTIVEYPP